MFYANIQFIPYFCRNLVLIMEEKKYDYRTYIKDEVNKAKEEAALKHWKRNLVGIGLSSVLFLALILAVFCGVKFSNNLPMLGIIASLTGVFFFSRELRIIPKGQLIASGIKAGLCWLMGLTYLILHQGGYGFDDAMLLMVLFGVPLLDLPKVLKALKALRK